MAVMVIIEAQGMGAEQYDQVMRDMAMSTADDLPPGVLSHVAGPTVDGWLVVDIWEDLDAFERFVEERLGAAAQRAGLPPLTPRVIPVHSLIAQGAGRDAGTIMMVEVPEMTTADYDAMVGRIRAHDGDGSGHPAVSHAAGPGETGLVVVDVWDSPESFAAFAQDEIASAGELPPLEPTFAPVHNHLRR